MSPYLACHRPSARGLCRGKKKYIFLALRVCSRALASLANSPMFSKFCVQATPYFTLVVILGSVVHCSFEQGLIISWLENRERLIVEYLRFTLLLKCLRSELEVDGGKQF